MCLKCPCVPNVPCVPNFPCVPNAPCVPIVQCVTNVSYVPNAQQILMENMSAMANINHVGGESHLLRPPFCTQRWGHVGLLLSVQCVPSVCLYHSFVSVCPALSIVQAVKQETLTQCWANVGPLSATLSLH